MHERCLTCHRLLLSSSCSDLRPDSNYELKFGYTTAILCFKCQVTVNINPTLSLPHSRVNRYDCPAFFASLYVMGILCFRQCQSKNSLMLCDIACVVLTSLQMMRRGPLAICLQYQSCSTGEAEVKTLPQEIAPPPHLFAPHSRRLEGWIV